MLFRSTSSALTGIDMRIISIEPTKGEITVEPSEGGIIVEPSEDGSYPLMYGE